MALEDGMLVAFGHMRNSLKSRSDIAGSDDLLIGQTEFLEFRDALAEFLNDYREGLGTDNGGL